MALFYLAISKKNDMVTEWYSGKNINIWNVIAQDFLYCLCGIIITYYLYNYLIKQSIIKKSYLFFVLTFVFIQLIGDISFASIISAWPEKHSSKWIQFFKRYINKSKYNALFGDSLYVIAWSISFYFVEKYIKSFSLKIFIISLFLFLTSAYSVK